MVNLTLTVDGVGKSALTVLQLVLSATSANASIVVCASLFSLSQPFTVYVIKLDEISNCLDQMKHQCLYLASARVKIGYQFSIACGYAV